MYSVRKEPVHTSQTHHSNSWEHHFVWKNALWVNPRWVYCICFFELRETTGENMNMTRHWLGNYYSEPRTTHKWKIIKLRNSSVNHVKSVIFLHTFASFSIWSLSTYLSETLHFWLGNYFWIWKLVFMFSCQIFYLKDATPYQNRKSEKQWLCTLVRDFWRSKF